MRTLSGETSTTGTKETAIVELDWEGNEVWSFTHKLIHHDFVRLANGNTLMVFRDRLPPEVARKVRGGRADSADGPMDGDLVREIDVSGESVREWRVWEQLDPENDVLCPLEPRRTWLRQNSLNLTRSGDLLVSFRQIDTVGIVDYASGKFVWKWGPGEVSHQHHATHLDNGNVLLFDNGPHRGPLTFSRVVEVDPAMDRSCGSTAETHRSRSPVSTSAARNACRSATRSSVRVLLGGFSKSRTRRRSSGSTSTRSRWTLVASFFLRRQRPRSGLTDMRPTTPPSKARTWTNDPLYQRSASHRLAMFVPEGEAIGSARLWCSEWRWGRARLHVPAEAALLARACRLDGAVDCLPDLVGVGPAPRCEHLSCTASRNAA